MLGVSSSLQSGLNGIHTGMQSFQASAEKIASQSANPQGTDLAEMAESVVDLMQAENQVAASAEVVKAGDEILGTLLDARV